MATLMENWRVAMARSENWRINKSSIMAVEGAQILRALQKVAGAAGLPKNYKVKFQTKKQGSGVNFNDKEVVIGAGRLFHEAPIPPELFDVLVGLTLHETGHQQIRSDRMWDTISASTRNMPQHELEVLQKFCNIGEDIVIESRIRANPNLADYDKTLHDWAVTQMRDAQPHKLLEVWIEYALGHKTTTIMDLPEELAEPMRALVALTGWLRSSPSSHPSQSGGYAERADAYLRYWRVVKDAILNPPQQAQPQNVGADGKGFGSVSSSISPDEPSAPAPDNQLSSGAESESTQNPEQSNEAAGQIDGEEDSAPEQQTIGSSGNADSKETELDRPLAPNPNDDMDEGLVEAVENAIQTESEDITEKVAQEFGEQREDGKYHKTYPVIRSRETKTPLLKPDPILRKRLERIMTIRKRLQTRTMHGERYGKIDKHHLHRIRTDERIFNLRYKFPDGFPNTRILIDLSSSMSGRQADEVLEAAGALQSIVNAEVWCYNEDYGKINLVRMDDGKLIHRFEPDGSTPSGLAIVGVSLGIKKDGLIIHLTDGQHNVGQQPWTAHWIVKKRGINLVNLIWGRSVQAYDYDGINYRQINGLAEFPDALYQILVEQSKLKIGGK